MSFSSYIYEILRSVYKMRPGVANVYFAIRIDSVISVRLISTHWTLTIISGAQLRCA